MRGYDGTLNTVGQYGDIMYDLEGAQVYPDQPDFEGKGYSGKEGYPLHLPPPRLRIQEDWD